MSATIIAEALAAAEAETPAVLHHHRVVVLNQHGRVYGDSGSLDLAEPQEWRTQFVRADVAEAALKHIAERLERAEDRAREEMTWAFWAGVCEQRAAECDGKADVYERHSVAASSASDWLELSAYYAATADKFRAWAKEAKL